jgi:hypothetical protein
MTTFSVHGVFPAKKRMEKRPRLFSWKGPTGTREPGQEEVNPPAWVGIFIIFKPGLEVNDLGNFFGKPFLFLGFIRHAPV